MYFARIVYMVTLQLLVKRECWTTIFIVNWIKGKPDRIKKFNYFLREPGGDTTAQMLVTLREVMATGVLSSPQWPQKRKPNKALNVLDETIVRSNVHEFYKCI